MFKVVCMCCYVIFSFISVIVMVGCMLIIIVLVFSMWFMVVMLFSICVMNEFMMLSVLMLINMFCVLVFVIMVVRLFCKVSVRWLCSFI